MELVPTLKYFQINENQIRVLLKLGIVWILLLLMGVLLVSVVLKTMFCSLSLRVRLQKINGLSRTFTITGPAMGEENACILTCHKVVNGSETVIFKARYSGVIQGLLLRVYNPATLELERDWNQMLVTIRWDGEEKPQIDRIPLGLFIGSAQGVLNPMDAVISGHQKISMYCILQKKSTKRRFSSRATSPTQCRFGNLRKFLRVWHPRFARASLAFQ